MVAKSFTLPQAPASSGQLVERSFGLWRASWRACLAESLLYGAFSLLPVLAFAPLRALIVPAGLALGLDQGLPWLPAGLRPDPAALVDGLRDWATAASTWGWLGASVLGSLACLSLLIHRQQDLARNPPAPWPEATRRGLARLPAGIGAWLGYAAILLALTLPLVLLVVLALGAGPELDLAGLLVLLLGFFFGGLLLSLPLAWASVAYGFAPFAAASDGLGALAALRRSAARVRRHWVHAALVLSVPMLIYLGAAGAISSLAMLLCLLASYTLGGWPAVLGLEWLGASYLVGWVPTAIVLPLLTAGGVVCWNDLALRGQAARGAALTPPAGASPAPRTPARSP